MTDYLKLDRNMVLAFISGLMVQNTKETGFKIKLKVKVNTHGQMEGNTRAHGKIICFMEQVFIHGLTEENMMENIRMT